MNKNRPTLKVSNPEKVIQIEGGAFANLVLHQSMHAENLRRIVQAISIINKDMDNEDLDKLQNMLQAMMNSTAGVLVEHVRIATEQGLVFQIDECLSNTTKH